jgi:hypothetical protein
MQILCLLFPTKVNVLIIFLVYDHNIADNHWANIYTETNDLFSYADGETDPEVNDLSTITHYHKPQVNALSFKTP